MLNFYRVYKSGHSIHRIALFHIQIVYNILSLLLSWFGLSAWLLTTFIITNISGKPPKDSGMRAFPFGWATTSVNAVIQGLYLVPVLFQLILAFGSKPKNQTVSCHTSFAIFTFVQIYFAMNVVYLMVRILSTGGVIGDKAGGGSLNYISTFYSSIGSLTVMMTFCAVFGVYYTSPILHFDAWHMFNSFPQYLFLLSCFTNILSIYAIANWHDVSWGSKTGKADVGMDSLTSVRSE
jgi:chitin synthase